MYASHFGLKHEPFSIAPDPRYLYMSERHREALAHLLYGVDGGGGFVLLSGEIGAGKTTVCRCFLEQIPPNTNVAYIFNPKLTVVELLQSICDEFGVVPRARGVHGRTTIKDFLDPLNTFLLESHAQGRNNLLIIDEAQMLSGSVLEQLRLLTNLETNERKLLQIVLIGQPELRDLLARPELEQLAQRVIARYHLDALTLAETERYIQHRLSVAGMSGGQPFEAKAIRRIHELSRGVPRRINLLCDRALLGAYGAGRSTVDRRIVDHAAAEVFDPLHGRAPARRRRVPAWLRTPAGLGVAGGGAVAIGALLAWGGYAWQQRASPPTAQAAAAAKDTAARRALVGSRPGTEHAGGAAIASAPGSGGSAGVGPGSEPGGAASGLASASEQGRVGPAAASAAPPPTYLTAADLRSRFTLLTRDEREAWRALAPFWQLSVTGDADPCAAAARASVQCWRSASSTLALIRQLDRPGILALRDENDKPIYALLTGLTTDTATLRIGTTSQTLALISLASLWRGDFATFWRMPAGYDGKPIDASAGPLAAWLGRQLATVNRQPAPRGEAEWRAQVSAFQLAQGLKSDGVAGPTTFMQLNRAAGVDEPRLTMTRSGVETSPGSPPAASAPTRPGAGAIAEPALRPTDGRYAAAH